MPKYIEQSVKRELSHPVFILSLFRAWIEQVKHRIEDRKKFSNSELQHLLATKKCVAQVGSSIGLSMRTEVDLDDRYARLQSPDTLVHLVLLRLVLDPAPQDVISFQEKVDILTHIKEAISSQSFSSFVLNNTREAFTAIDEPFQTAQYRIREQVSPSLLVTFKDGEQIIVAF